MPIVSIYLPDEVYLRMAEEGKPTKVAQRWIVERYEQEKEE